MSISAGTRLGPYEVVAPLGAGGMGEVWKARDTRLERSVAIKMLPAALSQNAQFRMRFEREARTISQLNHPHICTLYDVGDGYLVMELLEGESLGDRLTRGPLPIGDVLRYGAQIAQALERAHRAGITHRDLKPGNVMLTRHGAKLLDFGLAKESENGSGAITIAELTGATEQKPLTAEGTIVGTFQYMAPEQLEGAPVDQRTDIFALGALLYEMATGRRAFNGKSRASLIASILATTPEPISALQPMTPHGLDRIVRTCLAKDPDDRFQSAHDVRLELEWLGEAPINNTATAGVARKGRVALPWILAALFAVAALTTAAMLFREKSRQPSLVRSAILPPAGATFAFRGITGYPELSPDGTRVVFSALTGLKRLLYVRTLAEPTPQPLAGTEDGYLPFWSPDGRYIAFFANGKLLKIPAAGGSPVPICDVVSARGASWGRKGHIVFAERYSEIFRVPASGGTPVKATVLAKGEGSHRWPRFLPDGEHFIYMASKNGSFDEDAVAALGSTARPLRKQLLKGVANVAFTSEHLLYVRDGILHAHRFDFDELAVRGESLPLSHHNLAGDMIYAKHVFTASPGGTLVYQTGSISMTARFAWFDRKGTALTEFNDLDQFGSNEITPDQKSALTSIRSGSQSNLWHIDFERGVKTRLTFTKSVDVNPVYSPDGTTIAFASNRTGYNDLYLRDMRTGTETPLLLSEADKTPASWSPDGSTLYYSTAHRIGRSSSDIYTISIAHKRTRPLLTSPARETLPRVSPDGSLLTYMSEESGAWQAYVVPLPPTGAKWQISVAGGVQPRWSRNGREIVFLEPLSLKLMSVEVTRGTPPQFSRPSELFAIDPAQTPPNWDITNDGSRILLSARARDASAVVEPLTLVQNLETEIVAAERSAQEP